MTEISINQDEVHVWKLRLSNEDSAQSEYFESLLTEDESERAGKLRFDEDRSRFILARGHLRVLLGRYLNKKPRQIWIRYGRYGKPRLREVANPDNIRFNLSHSHDTVLYAVSKDREVGVDVEHLRPVAKADKIIERFFSEEEIAHYTKAPGDRKLETFFKLWCAREAYSKARGSGINMPGHRIDVSFATGKRINSPDTGANGPELGIYELTLDPGYIGYLAVSGKKPLISYRNIDIHLT